MQSGISEKDLQEIRLKVPLEMYAEVKDHLSYGGNPNKENENGITLVRCTVESLEFVGVKQFSWIKWVTSLPRKLNPQKIKKHSKKLIILVIHKITSP